MFKKISVILSKTWIEEINRLLESKMKNLYHIDYFSISVILPNNNIIILGTNYDFLKEYNLNNLGYFDRTYDPNVYKKFSIFPWVLSKSTNRIQEKILLIKQQFKLHSGINLVRTVKSGTDKLYVIYSAVSYLDDHLMQYKYSKFAPVIFKLGDNTYNALKHVFQKYTPYYCLPYIN